MATKDNQSTLATTTDNAPAKQNKAITAKVLDQISALVQRGDLVLPDDYNVGNALNSAWLKLQTINNKDQKPIILNGQIDTSIVTAVSVHNALFDYVIQGLNVSKNQAYFIVYGNALTCQRSYHGDMLLAKRVMPGITFFFDSIREGEKVKIQKSSCKLGIVNSLLIGDQDFPRNKNIIGAYCGVYDSDGENLGFDIMDIDRIKQSWSKSKTYKYSTEQKPTTHDEFPEEMCLRTVIRHRCKSIINASADAVLKDAVLRQEIDAIDAEVSEDVAENANVQILNTPQVQIPVSQPEKVAVHAEPATLINGDDEF